MRNFFLLSIFCFVANFLSAQNAEQRFLENLTAHRTSGTIHFMQGVSNSTSYVSLAVPVGMFTASLIGQDSIMQQKSFYILETIAVSTGIELVMKHLVNRPRPSARDSLIIPLTDIGSPSFPSGHTSISFATATSLSLAYPNWYVIVPSYLWACTVGFSRMYLGAHYPTDVLAGAIVGSGSAFLCREINKRLFRPKQNHKKIIWY